MLNKPSKKDKGKNKKPFEVLRALYLIIWQLTRIPYCVDTDPVLLEPKQDIYILTMDDALPSIRCRGYCNPGCNISWYRGPIIISNTDVLAAKIQPDDVMVEFVCHVTNTYTAEQLTTRVIVFRKGTLIPWHFKFKWIFWSNFVCIMVVNDSLSYDNLKELIGINRFLKQKPQIYKKILKQVTTHKTHPH